MRLWSRDQVRVPRGERRRRGGGRPPVYRTILDFGSAAIKALVVEIQDGQASVLGAGQASLGYGLEEPDGKALVQAAEQALVQAEDGTEATAERKVVPDFALLGLGGWTVRGRTVWVRHNRRRRSEPITVREVQAVFQRAQRLAQREAHKTGELEGRLRSLFAGVCSFEVEDRAVTTPVGFRGASLAIQVFNAFALERNVRQLEQVAEALELTVVGVVPVPCALALALAGRDALIVDVGGRWTDVVLVRDGRPVACGSLAWGGSHLTQALADGFRVTLGRGEESKLAYSAGRLDTRSAQRVQDVLSPPGAEWLEGVAGLVGHLCREEAAPHRIYVCGAGSLLPDCLEALQAYPWLETIRLERYPEVQPLPARALTGVRDRTGADGGPQQVPPLALARFAARLEARLEGPSSGVEALT